MEILVNILEARRVSRVVHFHCDHFEPCRKDTSGEYTALAAIRTLNEERLRHRHLQALSLFPSSQRCCYVENVSPERIPKMMPMGDIYFSLSSVAELEVELLTYLGHQPGIDFHVHLHHEWWTSSKCTGWPASPERDAARIRDVLTEHLAYYAKYTSIDVDNWGFVHGCWALNGSDKSICNITDEMQVLKSLGCVGDFTFPAGRSWCDPDLKQPHTVVPTVGYKAYVSPEADVRSVVRSAGAMHPDRFFIWSAATPTTDLSVETIAGLPPNAIHRVVQSWLATSPVIDGTLYIKTHCHSLWWEHWAGSQNIVPTLLSERFAQCFELLYRLPVDTEHWTVREVLAELRKVDVA